MGLFGKKKQDYNITEPTIEMIKNQDIVDDEEIEEEPQMIRAEPKSKRDLTMEDIERQKKQLDERVKEINEREKQLRPRERIQVVKEIPTALVRQYKNDDGSIVHLMTIEEYLTAQANKE